MAHNNIQMASTMLPIYISILQERKYRELSDAQTFLSDFETACSQIKALNNDFPDAILLMFLRGALKDAENPPAIGVNGTRYIDPET